MRKKLYILFQIIAVSFTVGFLNACRDVLDNDPVTNSPGNEHTEGDYRYLAIRFYDAAESSTRADEAFDSDFPDLNDYFNKGLNEEKAIYTGYSLDDSPHFLLFFDDESKELIWNKSLENYEWDFEEGTESNNNTGYTGYTTLYAVKNGVLDPDLENGIILVVLNASTTLQTMIRSILADPDKKYEDILSLVVGNQEITNSSDPTNDLYFEADGKKYFTMSSSMVVKNGEIIPANITVTNPYAYGHIQWYFNLEMALENPSYAMYVERLHAKYTLLFQKKGETGKYYYLDKSPGNAISNTYQKNMSLLWSSTSDFTPDKDFTKLRYVATYTRNKSIEEAGKNLSIEENIEEKDWKVNITGWAVNGLEKQENLFKNLNPEGEYYTGWNPDSYNSFRNFWAEDLNYSTGNYPDQYRNATGVTSYTDKDYASTLVYYKFNQLTKQSPHQYSPENTFSLAAFGNKALTEAYRDKDYMKVGTHVIVTAQLLIDGIDNAYSNTDSNGEISDLADKYYMNGIFWSLDAYKEYVAEYLAYHMIGDSRFENNDGIFYTEDPDEEDGFRKVGKDDFETVKAYVKGGDGYVRISLKNGVKLYTKDPDFVAPEEDDSDDKTIPFTPVEDDLDLNNTLFNTLVNEHPEFMAGHYNQGKMYYPVPIKHNTASKSDKTIALGDFGVVRNHWYSLTITNIAAPGTPVDDPDQEIIPNNEPYTEALGVNLRVLPWHEMETDVDISGQRPS